MQVSLGPVGKFAITYFLSVFLLIVSGLTASVVKIIRICMQKSRR